MAYATAASWPLYVMLGGLAGLLAAFYNRTLLAAISVTDRLNRWPVELQAGVIGAVVGVLAWFAPGLVGGGDDITQRVLSGGAPLILIPVAFLLRFGLGAVSYAAATPGGLFAPMLVLGAQLGLFLGATCRLAFPDLEYRPGSVRCGRDGRLLHRGGSSSSDRHRARHRDDRRLYDATCQ